ncbi:unnamed protein product, partial [Rotaria sp. Silwood2]
MPRLLSS